METSNQEVVSQTVHASAPAGAQAFDAFEKTVTALKDISVLREGGLTAYAIYAVALVMALALVLSIFVESLAGIVTTLIWAAVITIAGGVGANLTAGYLRFKTRDAATRHDLEALRLRALVASQRNDSVVKLLGAWSAHDARAFERTVSDHPNLLLKLTDSFDQINVRLGLEEARNPSAVGYLTQDVAAPGAPPPTGAQPPSGASLPTITPGGPPKPQA